MSCPSKRRAARRHSCGRVRVAASRSQSAGWMNFRKFNWVTSAGNFQNNGSTAEQLGHCIHDGPFLSWGPNLLPMWLPSGQYNRYSRLEYISGLVVRLENRYLLLHVIVESEISWYLVAHNLELKPHSGFRGSHYGDVIKILDNGAVIRLMHNNYVSFNTVVTFYSTRHRKVAPDMSSFFGSCFWSIYTHEHF